MTRAVRKKAPARPAKKPARKPVTSRKEKVPEPPKAPPAPKVSEAEKRAALAASAEAMRQKLWGSQGQPLTTVEGVTIASALLPRGRPHWHLLTFGLGLTGFELSLRVQKAKDELAAPAWAVTLLSTLITRARAGTLSADTNQVLLLSEGVAPGTDSEHFGLVFAPEPEAGSLVTPWQTVPVRLAVPVTRDEAKAVREWSPTGLIEVLSRVDPLLISDLDRPSLLQSPRARLLIDQRMEKEGSSLSAMSAEVSEVSKAGELVTWKLSTDAVDTLVSLLKGRIGHLRPFTVVSGDTRVEVVNAEQPAIDFTRKQLTVKLTLVGARQLRSLLRAKPGTYTFDLLPNFQLVVC